MKISLLSLGCKVNQAELAEIERALVFGGHEIVGLGGAPEICVINTCTVTAKSDYQSRQLIRRASRAGARVLVTGCYSQLNKSKVFSMEGVDDVVDISNKYKIISIINNKSSSNTTLKRPYIAGKTKLFLKIQDGCNYSCSYCLINRARGRSRSVPPEKVLDDINEAVSMGYREVVLTGIHLGLYGKDISPTVTLSGIIHNILKKTSGCRIRLSSLQAGEIGDDMLELLHEQRVCRHLHMPLQSGDDRILRLMGRNYDTSIYKETVKRVTKHHPEIALGTDIIIGFPCEGETEFLNTYRLAEGLPFTYMHIFPFSSRPGTRASEMPDTVGDSARSERASALRALAARKKKQYQERHIGQTLDVLLEKGTFNSSWLGTSGNYLKVRVSDAGHRRGDIVSVRVMGLEGDMLYGNT